MKIFRNIGANDNSIRNSGEGYKNAFTLAEMMVVLLIASVILACMAPIMTTKMKADSTIQTSPWKWAKDNVNAYYSVSSNQAAMIGQNERADTDNAKLIINNATNLSDMILFKSGENTLGHLQMTSTKVLLGNLASGTTQNNTSVAVGTNLKPSGIGSVAIGNSTSATGTRAMAVGQSAYASGSLSISVGYAAGSNVNTTGSYNIAIGSSSLRKNTSGGYNVAVGSSSLYNNTTGRLGLAIGNYSLYSNTTGNNNIAIGYKALYSNKVQNSNIAIGAEALQNFNNDTADGAQTNIAIGTSAMSKTTKGHTNTFIGTGSGYNNTEGSYNTGLGHAVLQSNTTANNNTALGYASAQHITGSENTSIGALSLLRREKGHRNTAVGYRALGNPSGYGSGGTETNYTDNSNDNTALGYYACANVAGSNKTCIGANSGPAFGTTYASSSNTDKIMFLGDASTTVYIPGNLVVGGISYLGYNLDKTRNGTYTSTTSGLYVNLGSRYGSKPKGEYGPMVTTPTDDSHLRLITSDRRLKNVGKENTDGLAKLRQLKIYNYTYKADKDKIPQVGVIAQDLQKVFPNAVKKASDGFLKIRLEDMFYAVINAIKELDTRVTRLEKENQMLREQNKALELRLQALEKKIK